MSSLFRESDFPVKFPEIKADLRPKTPYQAAMDFALKRYGYNFYLDENRDQIIDKTDDCYLIKLSAKIYSPIKDDKTGKKKLIIISLKNFLEVLVTKDLIRKEYRVKGPHYKRVQKMIISKINEIMDKRYESFFFREESIKKRFANLIFVQSQFNPIKNICTNIFENKVIDSKIYSKKMSMLNLLIVSNYLKKRGGALYPTEKAYKFLEKSSSPAEFSEFVIGDLVLNYQKELDKRYIFAYKPYLKLSSMYYEEADLFSFIPDDIFEDYFKVEKPEILTKLRDELVANYVKRYGRLSVYREDNLFNFIDDLIRVRIFEREPENYRLVHGEEEIFRKMKLINPIKGVEEIEVETVLRDFT